jgi:hypothetical protein
VTPSRLSTLLALAIGAAAVAWGAVRLSEGRGATLPPLPWAAPVGLAVLALAVLASAVALRARLRGRPGTRPPRPLGVARMAVLGKASAHAGALLAGAYAGYVLVLAPSLGIEARRDRALVAAAATLAAVLLTAAGLLLERTCRVRGGDDGTPPPAASGP